MQKNHWGEWLEKKSTTHWLPFFFFGSSSFWRVQCTLWLIGHFEATQTRRKFRQIFTFPHLVGLVWFFKLLGNEWPLSNNTLAAVRNVNAVARFFISFCTRNGRHNGKGSSKETTSLIENLAIYVLEGDNKRKTVWRCVSKQAFRLAGNGGAADKPKSGRFSSRNRMTTTASQVFGPDRWLKGMMQ